ncbi:MAG: hypothetical protein ACRDBO_14645 [Lachnospiraceae bacterium]
MSELSIIKQYPKERYNLLGNTELIAKIPDIKSPVVQAVVLETDPSEGDVYIQTKAKAQWTDKSGKFHPATLDFYAITKNGLKKLADGAGIKMVSSEHVVPSTCQKCVAVNQNCGKVVQCGNCNNKDVAYRVTISVPQLTGEILTVTDNHEIIVENTVIGMSDKQRMEFMRHLPQICEAKALNGAIRTALHIKGTYTLDELRKPFVVAYLVPNLDNEDVKGAAIDSMFASSNRLFGKAPCIQQIESRIMEPHSSEVSASDDISQYVDESYYQEPEPEEPEPEEPEPEEPEPEMPEDRSNDFRCDKCDVVITEKVWNYSVEKDGQPLCYKCQKRVRDERRGGMR